MQWNSLKALLLIAGVAFLAICCGFSVAMGEYRLFIIATGLAIVVGLIVTPGYAPLLALGIFCPITLPLPFVWQLPFMAIILIICVAKLFFEQGIKVGGTSRVIRTMSVPFALLFGWVFIRYCMNPSLPNVMGFGRSTTGFRAYLAYAIVFVLVLFLGRFLRKSEEMQKLLRAMTFTALFFAIIFIPLVFTKSGSVAMIFNYLGVFVAPFDNGMLRFVILPFFGILLISVSMLPLLFPTTTWRRRALFVIGVAAVVLGGTRSGAGMAVALMFSILFLRKLYLRLSVALGLTLLAVVGIYFAGQRVSQMAQIGLLRPLALISPAVAESTDAALDWEWRKVRWERAMEIVREHPVIGEGYGAVENAFIAGDAAETEETGVQVALQEGGVHNGYLACACALGVPAALLFIYILLSRIFITSYRAFTLKKDTFAAQLNCFLAANLIAEALTISIGTDVNDSLLWFYLALSVLAGSFAMVKARSSQPAFRTGMEPAGRIVTA